MYCASPASAAGRTLTATSRLSFPSRARYTSPIPPAPKGARISYGPKRSPVLNGIAVLSFYSKRTDPHSQHRNRTPIHPFHRKCDRIALLYGAEHVKQRQVVIGGR